MPLNPRDAARYAATQARHAAAGLLPTQIPTPAPRTRPDASSVKGAASWTVPPPTIYRLDLASGEVEVGRSLATRRDWIERIALAAGVAPGEAVSMLERGETCESRYGRYSIAEPRP